MDTGFISSITQFGAGIVLAVVVFVAYQQLVGRVCDVLKSNTEVLTELKLILQSSESAVRNHEQRSIPERAESTETLKTAGRIENKVDRIAEQQQRTQHSVGNMGENK